MSHCFIDFLRYQSKVSFWILWFIGWMD